jgi:DNA-binding beta-propeller fold protein YncE
VVYTPEMTLTGHVMTCVMPHGSRVNTSGTLQYSGCMMDDQAVEIDTRTFQVSRRFSVAAGKEGLLKVAADEHAGHDMKASPMPPASCSPTWAQPSPDEKFLYVACNRAKTILELDLANGSVTRRFATPVGPYNFDFTRDGAKLVVSQKAAGTVTIWDRAKGIQLAELKTGRKLAHGVAITPDGRFAFVTSEGLNGEPGSVDVVDIDALQVVAHADVGKQAGGVAFWKTESH